MEAYWRRGDITPRILDLGCRWRKVVSFVPLALYPQGKSPRWIGAWVASRANPDAVVKVKIPSPCQDSNYGSSSP
jgi:hypothetical protein